MIAGGHEGGRMKNAGEKFDFDEEESYNVKYYEGFIFGIYSLVYRRNITGYSFTYYSEKERRDYRIQRLVKACI